MSEFEAAAGAHGSAEQAVSALLAACIGGSLRQAADIVEDDPAIGRRDLRAAAALGDVPAAQELLTLDPRAATTIDDDRGWPPLLYSCYSRWHHGDPDRVPGMAGVARLLIETGANPNTNDAGRQHYRSALRGSVEVNNPDLTELLLEGGADPDPGAPIAEAVGHRDHRCLKLLLAHGARVERSWALGAAVYHDDAEAISLLLDAVAAGGGDQTAQATEALADAAANASLPVVAALLEAGADPNVTDDEGMSALRRAVRWGRSAVAESLRAAGATEDGTDVDRLLGACMDADRQAIDRLLATHPGLRHNLSEEDRGVIVDAAGTASADAMGLLLDFGLSPHERKSGEQALHTAAYSGNAPVVRVLLAAGADVDARDERFDATPMAFATVGSREQAGRQGDWIETVSLLIEAGASVDGSWVAGKPPSEEVMELLRGHGIGPEPEDPPEATASVGTGVLGDMSRHLEAAYRGPDLDLLGSLLHPEVHWTGTCTNKDQVLDWYRALVAAGTHATVESVEVDRDAVILGLTVVGHAEGARPAPQHVYQVFTVKEAQIVDIRGYPDRASALGRA